MVTIVNEFHLLDAVAIITADWGAFAPISCHKEYYPRRFMFHLLISSMDEAFINTISTNTLHLSKCYGERFLAEINKHFEGAAHCSRHSTLMNYDTRKECSRPSRT